MAAIGGGGSARRGGFGGRRRTKLGFWLGLLVGSLSVLAPLWATSEHDAAASTSTFSATTTTASSTPGREGAAAGKRTSNARNEGPSSREPLLKATLRRESLQDAPSCVHTFGQLELINGHPTDSIVIHSIRTVDEVTVPAAPSKQPSMRANVTYGCWEDYRAGAGGSGADATDDGENRSASGDPARGDTATYSSGTNGSTASPSFSTIRLPRQVQVSNLPTSSFVLGANQIAIVPVSFLPRFPPVQVSAPCMRGSWDDDDIDDDNDNDNLGSTELPRPAPRVPSEAQRRDLEQWLGSKRRSNRFVFRGKGCAEPETYTVSATVVVESSVGELQLPLEATSQPINDYGLPDRITFPPHQPAAADGIKHPSAAPTLPPASSVHVSWRRADSGQQDGAGPLPASSPSGTGRDGRQESDCYDLYIQHPASPSWETAADGSRYDDGPFTVLAVTVSMPDRVSVTFSRPASPSSESAVVLSGHDAASPSADHFERNDWQPRDEYGGFVGGAQGIDIPADGRPHYLASLCPNRDFDGSRPPASSPNSNANPLPSYGGSGRSADNGKADEADGGTVMVSPTEEESWMGYVNILTSHDSLFISLERRAEGPIESAFSLREEAVSAAVEGATVLACPNAPHPDVRVSYLRVHPASIDVQLMSSSSSRVSVPIDVSNTRAIGPIRIMRASVVYDAPKELQAVNVTIGIRGAALSEDSSIDSNETLDGGLLFECSVDWEKFFELTQQQRVAFAGTVLLRGSRMRSYDEWEAYMKVDPSLDGQFVTEIPFRVELIKGEIGMIIQSTSHPDGIFWSYRSWGGALAVSAAFFPASQDGVRASLSVHQDDAFYRMEAMEHHIRVFSNVGAATQIRRVEVRPTKESTQASTSQHVISMCNCFDASVLDARDYQFEGVVNGTDVGLIELVYKFPASNMSSTENQNSAFPVTCYLQLSTEPDTGSHFMPLVIYTGHVDLDSNRQTGVAGSTAHENTVWHRTIVGFDNVLSWLLQTKAGEAFRAILESASKKSDDTNASFERYLKGISLDLVNKKVRPFLRPILVQAGAINHGETEVLPLYMTNTNPVPIEAWIDVGEVEGLSIALGRDKSTGRGDGNNILDYLPSTPHSRYVDDRAEPRVRSGSLRGHPVNGLRQFLMQDHFVASFLSEFPYRAAISLSAAAVARLPMLQYLFMTFSLAEFYRNPLPLRFASDAWSRCDNAVHPPLYGAFDRTLALKTMPGPIIVSSDGRSVRNLPVCWDRQGEPGGKRRSEDTSIHIPPGATARFDVTLRAPSQAVLKKDITQFLSTGLVLSTNHGEVMPIFVAFEALQGRFDVSYVDTLDSLTMPHDGVIRVPMKLFDPPLQGNITFYLKIPPRTSRPSSAVAAGEIITHNVTKYGGGLSLYMKSTFSRDVRLRQVISCNPWFAFQPVRSLTPTIDPIRGLEIGSIRTSMSCDNPIGLLENVTWNPSYFLCLLNWLVNRTDLQPSGCGQVSAKEMPPGKDSSHRSEVRAVDRAVRSIKRALIVSQYEHGSFLGTHVTSNNTFKLRHRATDGTATKSMVGAMAEAWDAWRALAEYGYRTTGTSMRAIIDYNSTDGDALPVLTQVLSVAMRNLTIESVFKTPRLFDASRASLRYPEAVPGSDDDPGMIRFPDAFVAGVSHVYIPLRNPTSVPVKVRLSVTGADSTDEFPSSIRPKMLDSFVKVDDSVKHRFLQRMMSPFVQSREYEERGHQESSAHNDWWGERCGFIFVNDDGDLLRSRHNVSITNGVQAIVRMYNPSIHSSVSFLTGCGSRCGVKDDSSKSDGTQTPTMGCGAAVGSRILGEHRWRKHRDRVYSSMPSAGAVFPDAAGPSAFALPFSSLDEVVIPPNGEAELGPILFRPPGRFSTIGCRARLNAGRSGDCASEDFQALLLLENSLTGIERVVLKGGGKLQRVDFVDPDLSDGSDSFGSIEIRNGLPTLFFSGPFSKGIPGEKEALLWNSGDVPVYVASVSITASSDTRAHAPIHERTTACEFGGFSLRECEDLNEGFTLDPGQNRSIVVEHRQRCKFRRDVVSLSVIIERRGLEPKEPSMSGELTNHLAQTGRSRYERANAAMESTTLNTAQLMIGYDMSKADFASCKPTKKFPTRLVANPASQSATKRHLKHHPYGSRTRTRWNFALSTSFLLSAVAAMNVLSRRWLQRKRSSTTFHSILSSTTATHSARSSPLSGLRWRADFWYLARVDPSSQDLQSLSRERVRHVTLSRYRNSGALVPNCINGSGGFQREKLRPGAVAAVNKESGPERNKTLSDALFRNFIPPGQGLGRLPCDLNWKTAYARGLLDDEAFSGAVEATKTRLLLTQRLAAKSDESVSSESQSVDDFLFSDSGSASSEVTSDFSEIEVPNLSSSVPQLLREGNGDVVVPKAREPFEVNQSNGIVSSLLSEKPAQPAENESSGSVPPSATSNASEHSHPPERNGEASLLHPLEKASGEGTSSKVSLVGGSSHSPSNQRVKKGVEPHSSSRNAKPTDAGAGASKGMRSDASSKPDPETKVLEKKKRAKPSKPDRPNVKSVGAKGPPKTNPAAPKAPRADRPAKKREGAWGPKPGTPDAASLAGSPFRPPPGLPPPPGFAASAAHFPPPAAAATFSSPSRGISATPTTPSHKGSHSPVIARPTFAVTRTPSIDSLDLLSGHSPILPAPPPPVSSSRLGVPSLLGHGEQSANSGSFASYPPNSSTARRSPLSLLQQQASRSSAAQGFDIMDFLDGVLNEGGSSAGATWDEMAAGYDAARDSSLPPELAAVLSGGGGGIVVSPEEDDSNNNSLSGLVPPLVSANPWASEPLPESVVAVAVATATTTTTAPSASSAATAERQSRLSALYGISIEDVSERSSGGGGGAAVANGLATSGSNNNSGNPGLLLAADVLDGDDLLLVDLFPVTTIAEADEGAQPSAAAGLQDGMVFPVEEGGGAAAAATSNDRDPEVSFLSDSFG